MRLGKTSAAAFGLALLLGCLLACAGMAQEPVALATSQNSSGAIALGAGPTEVAIAPVHDPNRREPTALASRLRALAPNTRVYLVLQGARSDEAPGVTYNIYLNLPANSAGQGVADPHFVGSFSFFDAEAPRDLSINVTDQLKRMTAAGLLRSDARLTIVPVGALSRHAKPEIAKIRMMAQ